MFQYTITLLRAFFSLVFTCFVFLFLTSSASAASYEVTGWGWGADNNIAQGFGATVAGLGWISFSNISDGTAIPYGVFIDTATGDFSGYAWSSNAGWITFNAGEMKKCSTNLVLPTPPSTVPTPDNCPAPGPHKAHLDTTFSPITGAITGGTGNVTGWARACSVFVSGCSGTVRPDNQTGTWDGWISLSGAGYGLNAMTLSSTIMKFRGPNPSNILDTTPPFCPSCFAWGGGTGSNTGFGWGINLGGLDVALLPSSVPPLLSFWADQTTLAGSQTTLLHWITGGPGLVGCTAGGTDTSWSGPKLTAPTVRSQPVGPLTSSKTYTLQCFGPDGISSSGIPPPPTDDTRVRTVNIAFTPVPVPIDGICGPAAGSQSRKAPTANLCSSGDPSAVIKDISVTPNQWKWTCSGFNGGVLVDCLSGVRKTFNIIEIGH